MPNNYVLAFRYSVTIVNWKYNRKASGWGEGGIFKSLVTKTWSIHMSFRTCSSSSVKITKTNTENFLIWIFCWVSGFLDHLLHWCFLMLVHTVVPLYTRNHHSFFLEPDHQQQQTGTTETSIRHHIHPPFFPTSLVSMPVATHSTNSVPGESRGYRPTSYFILLKPHLASSPYYY